MTKGQAVQRLKNTLSIRAIPEEYRELYSEELEAAGLERRQEIVDALFGILALQNSSSVAAAKVLLDMLNDDGASGGPQTVDFSNLTDYEYWEQLAEK